MRPFKLVSNQVLEQSDDPEQAFTPRHNLPLQFTPVIGRDREITSIRDRLLRPDIRLLTLAGPAGIGKTRLSLQVAAELIAEFPDGVYFIPLASITDPLLVLSAIGQTLELREALDQPLLKQIQRFIRDKQLLLVLDNFEQVIDAAPLVSALLQSCPQLKLLITSRTVLRISGEHKIDVPPLGLPSLRQLPDPQMLAQHSAIALFVERAKAVRSDFMLNQENAASVAEICARLDGLPLAIELAAARLKLLSLSALQQRLSSRLSLLTEGTRDLLAHQQTLRKTLDWSYDLLNDQERQLFTRLGVFVAGCTLEGAEAVAHFDSAPGKGGEEKLEQLAQGDILDGIASLLDKSMLHRDEQRDGEPRFKMLETLREYALEWLETHGETALVRRHHASYYMQLVERAMPELVGAQQGVWLDRLEEEHDNIRAAIQWAIEQGESEIALRITAALWRFWHVRGYLSEGRRWLDTVLSIKGDHLGHKQACVQALAGAGWMACVQGDLDQARQHFESSLNLARELSDQRGIGQALSGIGRMAHLQGNYAQAEQLYQESLTIFRKLGDQKEVGWSLSRLGILALEQSHFERASALFEESLSCFRNAGFKWGSTWALIYLGDVMLEQGDYHRATALFEESLSGFRTLGDKEGMATSLTNLGRVALAQGDIDHAAARYRESLGLYQELGAKLGIAECLEVLGRLSWTQEKSVHAVRLFGAAELLRNDLGAPLPPAERARYERILALAQSQMGPESYAKAWREGQTMTPDQVMAEQRYIATTPQVLITHQGEPEDEPLHASLTARELDVLRLVATGLTDAQVAAKLYLSPRTINSHLRSIYSKLGVSSRSAATRYAIEHKLLD